MRIGILIMCALFSMTILPAQTTIRKSMETQERAIRKDVPLTNSIRRAMEAGTRDFTGKPGPNYWQLKTDYTIEVSLNPGNQTLYGAEDIEVHNNSQDELKQIVLHLDHNIFRAFVPRGSSVPAETTAGMVVTRLAVDGVQVDLTVRPPSWRSRGAAPTRTWVAGLDQTVARIILKDPIPKGAKTTLSIEWNTKLPGGPNGRGHRMTQRWDNTTFQPTQWFPRLAKYDDLRGWETNPYLGPAEFHNNFGSFDVKIDVPAGWLVSGTGILQNPEEVLSEKVQDRLTKVLDSDD